MLKRLFALGLFYLLIIHLPAQSEFLHFGSGYQRDLEQILYTKEVRFHTSIRSYERNDIEHYFSVDSVFERKLWKKNFATPWKQKAWDMLFNSDFYTKKGKDYSISANFLADFGAGKNLETDKNTWVNTRGLELKVRLGERFSFYTVAYENQAVFVDYLDDYIRANRVVPGQGMARNYRNTGFDYASSSGHISFKPGKHSLVQLGHGKNFIGDGYRSLLLSDNSFNNLYFKAGFDFWHLKYQVLWNQYIDIRESIPELGYARKYSKINYLSWTATKRLTIGFFESVVWEARNEEGDLRGFDLQYINPIIFMRPLEFSLGSPDNELLGLNLSLLIGKRHVFYGQFILDEFKLSELSSGNGWWANKFGYQLGYKNYAFLGIPNLFVQSEYNRVRPYTYSHADASKNYGHYNQPLAHPYGANFWEWVSFVKYNYKRIFFEYQFILALYGDDPAGMNYGKDIYKDYTTAQNQYGNSIGQGIKTQLIYQHLSASVLINPATNLNLSAGIVLRNKTTDNTDERTKYIYFGLRSAIGNRYYDF
jgi:hypothetical protein